jgi:hypothetical protein
MEARETPTSRETTPAEIQHMNVDATFDIAKEAIGGTAEQLGQAYYRSPNFIGSVAVSLYSVTIVEI